MADQAEWFTNPEHAHIIGLDDQLASALRSAFEIAQLQVDCGVEGKGPYTYHFRISNVPADMHGHVSSRAMDLLSSWTAYRFEVYCI
ncbi:MAG TPA: hypothetical protein VFC56_07555 [Stellaceae bacterium]|nr:hypothetical protein [Stellaceae bacterium]